MTFYHFCADRHIKGILRNGLTEVGNRRVHHGRIPREYIKAYERSL